MDRLNNEVVSSTPILKPANGRPSPDNFDAFLPWACVQLQVELEIVIVGVLNKLPTKRSTSHVGKSKPAIIGKSKLKQTGRAENVDSDIETIKSEDVFKGGRFPNEETIKVYTTYDNVGHLLHIKFDKNKHVPLKVLQIIGLIVDYHIYLTGMTINRGINEAFLKELNKLLIISNITDVCLDNTAIPGGAYDSLLENKNKLTHLSMSRCNIKNDVVKRIASHLVHPLPASQTLLLLNLASNFITDIGAKYLAEALRSNRRLVYLNLAGNSITDEGTLEILNVLGEFVLLDDELMASRARHVEYIKEKRELTNKILHEMRTGDFDKKVHKKRSMKPLSYSLKRCDKGSKDFEDVKEKDMIFDPQLLDKAAALADTRLGEFHDPFIATEIKSINQTVYCYGNNSLAYLNIAYTNISYITVKKILTVLKYQKLMDRKPKGLININIEGNCIPKECVELGQINTMLTTLVVSHQRRLTVMRKRV